MVTILAVVLVVGVYPGLARAPASGDNPRLDPVLRSGSSVGASMTPPVIPE